MELVSELSPRQRFVVAASGGDLVRFGHGARARTLYRRYVEEAIRSGHEESPLEEVKAGLVLGGEEFLCEGH